MATRDYRADGLIIHWDSERCVHAARCWRNLPDVFQPWTKPWVVPDGAPADRIRRVIDLCPSGALAYTVVERSRMSDADGYRPGCAPELQAEIDALAQGASPDEPVAVGRPGGAVVGSAPQASGSPSASGGAEVDAGPAATGTIGVMPNGPLVAERVEVVAVTGAVLASGRVALCRCGGSSRKPFCDGAHARNGFDDAGKGPA